MIPTSFSSDVLHPDRVNEDDGSLDKLFVRLVYDLFIGEYTALSYHDGGGKDGAIDLWSDVGNERHIFECKQFGIGKKGQPWEAAQSSWKKVQKNLEKNLLRGHDGCQSQYRPWFNNSPCIVRYTFIVSCTINPSPDRLDELRRNIKSTFEELSNKSGELSHLKDIVVDVVDWNTLRRKLEVHPQVHFKWFSNRLPVGLRQFTQDRHLSDFRRFQQEDVLPYYSLRAHLENRPRDGIPDEDSLWKSIAGGAAGLVISGVSGVGKSRLMMELGKLAVQDGWLVFEATNVGTETIDRVTRSHSSEGVLFLFDYLENLPAFRDISLHIAQLAGSGIKVRLIASARESFVKSDQIFDDSMLVFLHSTEEGEDSSWWNTYRMAAVEHITSHLGIKMKSDSSSNIPAVAVLESSLLRGTLSPADVESAKTWAAKHLSTLRRENVSQRSLALVAAQCPFDDEAYSRLSDEPYAAFVVLKNSGWIEARDTETGHGSYWIVHDYLADQIVLHWLEVEGPRGLAKTAEIRALLKLAYSLKTLGSVVATLQRIIGKVNGFGLDVFSNLLESEIAANRDIWKIHRQDVLYTRLLSPHEKVLLLYRLGNYWQGAETESWFQLEIAVLAKAFTNVCELKGDLPEEAWRQFETLIVSLVSASDERNMLITYGLRLLPMNERLKKVAVDWLEKFADRFDATYVIRAWLDMNLPWRRVEQAIGVWLSRFGKSVDAQFVLAAWLRAAEEKGITQFSSEIMVWCKIHKTEIVAQHVYSAWLEATGSTREISGYVQAWLAQNGAMEDKPSFLIKRWLRAGGEASLILPYLKRWLDLHGRSDSASFVYAASIDVDELKHLVKDPMLEWISTHTTSVLANTCLIEWLRAGHDTILVAEHVRSWLIANDNSLETGEVIVKWLEAKGALEMVLPYALKWLGAHDDSQYCSFLLKSLLERENAPDEVLRIAVRWLESRSHKLDAELVLSAWLRGHHGTESIQQPVIEWCRRFPTEIQSRYIYEQWLIEGGHHQVVSQYLLAWLVKYDRESDAGRVLGALSRVDVPWDAYQESMTHWLDRHCRDRDASFFYCAWLSNSGRNPTLIRNSVTAWLESNAKWKDAYFVLNDWLKHEGTKTEIVRAGYESWMATHRQIYQAQKLRKS
jgi:hypothetical protein